MAVESEQKVISFEPLAHTYGNARDPTAGANKWEGSLNIRGEPSLVSLTALQPFNLVKFLEPRQAFKISGRIASGRHSAPAHAEGIFE